MIFWIFLSRISENFSLDHKSKQIYLIFFIFVLTCNRPSNDRGIVTHFDGCPGHDRALSNSSMAPLRFFNFFTKLSTAFSAHFSSSSPCFQPSNFLTAGLVKENRLLRLDIVLLLDDSTSSVSIVAVKYNWCLSPRNCDGSANWELNRKRFEPKFKSIFQLHFVGWANTFVDLFDRDKKWNRRKKQLFRDFLSYFLNSYSNVKVTINKVNKKCIKKKFREGMSWILKMERFNKIFILFFLSSFFHISSITSLLSLTSSIHPKKLN